MTELPANHFKRAIKSGRQQIGLWCSLASNISVEIVAGSGAPRVELVGQGSGWPAGASPS